VNLKIGEGKNLANSDPGKILDKIIGKGKRREAEKVEKREEKEAVETSITPSPTSKIYLKALPLHSLDDLEKIKNEVKSGNILIVRVGPLAEKSIDDVKRAINELSEFVKTMGGDIARLGEERIVLTPPNIQIWREKASPSTEVTSP
jgi:SepF-like predicted cell division protein (DUF552 family)